MNTRTGTHHFQTKEQAVRYYARQEYRPSEVAMMLTDGSIAIGPPTLKRGESFTTDADGRYWITEAPNPLANRLPLREDVQTVTYHRPPTAAEIRFGEGGRLFNVPPQLIGHSDMRATRFRNWKAGTPMTMTMKSLPTLFSQSKSDANMKIKPEHYNYMRQKTIGYISRNPGAIAEHRAKLAPYSGDIEKRIRWDVLRVACGMEWVCETLYPYANDTHIETALRTLQKELHY